MNSNLEAKEVGRWISSDEISVAVEADVFKILLKWIEQNKSERKASFEELFRHVRLASLSRDFLIDVVTNKLVQENSNCLSLVLDAINLMAFPEEENLLQSPRKELETRAIVACGGKYTFCYLPEKDMYEWKRLADGQSERNHLTKMLTYRDQLYAFPSCGKAERYDPVFDCWSTLADHVEWPTKDPAEVTVVRGEIYSIEINTSSKKSTIKRYNVERCSWQTVLSSHEGCREDSCVVAAGNHLYVCGGRIEDEYLTKAERFDTVENKWEEIANMQQQRVGSFGAATEGKIFLAGGGKPGEGFKKCLETCEMYNISTSEWQLIGSLNVPRAYGSMVCLNGSLYVLGGSEEMGFVVECYDPTEDKWNIQIVIPVQTISKDNKDTFTGCVLKLSKGVLDKLDVIN